MMIMYIIGQGWTSDGTGQSLDFLSWSRSFRGSTLSRSVGICCLAGFLSRDCPAEFCPGLDYPAALSPGPTSEIRVPGPGF